MLEDYFERFSRLDGYEFEAAIAPYRPPRERDVASGTAAVQLYTLHMPPDTDIKHRDIIQRGGTKAYYRVTTAPEDTVKASTIKLRRVYAEKTNWPNCGDEAPDVRGLMP